MHTRRLVCTLTVLLLGAAPSLFATSYQTVGLVASDATVAAQYGVTLPPDPSLINPWGMSFSATSPFWVSNQGMKNSTLYSGAGVKNTMLTVAIPPTATGPQGPTGQVFNSAGTGNFVVSGTAAAFIFDTLAGTIDAWQGGLGMTAAQVAATSGAVYTGLTLASVGTTNYLYAANFTNGGGIRVFDNTFTDVTASTFAGKFVDSNAPAGYAPYNVQVITNNNTSLLYVEYAQVGTGGAVRAPGLGFVDVFDTSGNLQKTLIGTGGTLNAPWGVALAPSDFGDFSNDLLVGNFGDGLIHAYDPNSGALKGTLANGGIDIVIPGLWGLDFRTNGGSNSVPNGLYFTAGINGPTNQSAGLFGYVAPVPEPSAYGLAGLGIAGLLGFALSRGKVRARP